MSDTPAFVEGARVAIEYATGFNEGVVAKVYKNGNFVLRGDKQQWKPRSPDSNGVLVAWRTGRNSWDRDRVILRNEAAEQMIHEKLAQQARIRRFRKIRHRVDNLREPDLTDAMLDQLEAILGPKP